MKFTEQQQRVIDARGRNILVSAAAGSGKTAVLVERIIQEITEGEHPVDVDRLLVVTFTRAAASQMRERIAAAIASRLEQDPGNRHLQRQETLLHNAQITTIDSFCTFLLHNNFSEIGLDPGFRQMDETETKLLLGDTMESMLEEAYADHADELRYCVEYFCDGLKDTELSELILDLYRRAESHPWPEEWLLERREDYACADAEDLLSKEWVRAFLQKAAGMFLEYDAEYSELVRRCLLPGGPFPYEEFLRREQEKLFGGVRAALKDIGRTVGEEDASGVAPRSARECRLLWNALRDACAAGWDTLPSIRGKKKEEVDEDQQNAVKAERSRMKESIRKLGGDFFAQTPEEIAEEMHGQERALHGLIALTLRFMEAFRAVKKDKNVIDFDDLEHFALDILTQREADGRVVQSRAAEAYRNYFHEILIDEYQDSNDVQELMLRMISGESAGRRNRFMVGDVKQSIYRFRLARPEIFMDKYERYRRGEEGAERIDLDRNFRSRRCVLDSVNAVFSHIMRPEVGGILYGSEAFLRHGAGYYPGEEEEDAERSEPLPHEGDPFETELLLLNQPADSRSTGAAEAESAAAAAAAGSVENAEDPSSGMNARRLEAQLIAQRIRGLLRSGQVTDGGTGRLRNVRFGDIVILFRAFSGVEEYREVLEEQGIPCHVSSRTGYFAASEIRVVLQLLKILDNPRQDIPLYGTLHGFFGGFTEEECALIRASAPREDFYTALTLYAGAGQADQNAGGAQTEPDADARLAAKCRAFLDRLSALRGRLLYLSVHELLEELFETTGYGDYVRALPGGGQRAANLSLFMTMALNFEQTSYSGLFHFLRYIDQIAQREIDMGEANTLDEHADVVRMMTIHKSKGLEFPVCILAGTARRLNTRDQSGMLLGDSRWGIGFKWCDVDRRLSSDGFRRAVIADRIAAESLGEELRVLYVAMTRAKEKLIITGTVRDYESAQKKRSLRVSAVMQGSRAEAPAGAEGAALLPVSLISASGSYLDLLLDAAEGAAAAKEAEPFRIRVLDAADLELEEAGEQGRLFIGREELDAVVLAANEKGTAGLPDPALAERLLARFSCRYPHEELRGLYTKTTVSELKRAEARRLWSEEESLAASQAGVPLFASAPGITDSTDMQDAAPRGVVPGITGGSDRTGAPGITGAARGTVLHRCMELLDFRRFADPGAATEEDVLAWREELSAGGMLLPEEAQLAAPSLLLPFLHSPLCAQMAEADRRGVLLREQPFVMGVPASRMGEGLPESETVLVQGIIDAFFAGEEGIVLLDYKTDHVQDASELIRRYRIQLELYAEALERMLGSRVTDRLIWSFALGKAVKL